MSNSPKRMLFVFRRAPYGTIYAQEALEVLMMSGAFNQTVCAAFLDDGVFQLIRGQEPSVSGMKQFTRTFAALGDFDVAQVFIENESLQVRGLGESDLIEILDEDGDSLINIVSTGELSALMDQQDVVLQF